MRAAPRRPLGLLLATIVGLSCAHPRDAKATDYYVDGAYGADTGHNGHVDQPFATIAHAATQVVAGDSVTVLGMYDSHGDPVAYHESGPIQLLSGISGSSPSAMIVFRANPNEACTGDAMENASTARPSRQAPPS
jgi:hypothetical protein